MFKCPECLRLFNTIIEIKDHLKYIHAYGLLNFHSIVCPDESCSTEISSWSGFWLHLKSFHGENSFEQVELVENFETENVGSEFQEFVSESFPLDDFEILQEISVEQGIKLFTDLLYNFCSSLLASGVNNSTVDLVIREMRYSFSQLLKIISNIGRKFSMKDFESFSCQINGLLAAFNNVKSSYQRLKLCNKHDKMIEIKIIQR